MDINTSRASPNFSSRNGAPVSLLVLHSTGGPFADALAWLCSAASHVSAHYLIAKNGSIYQLVDTAHAAWHAGQSAWQGLDSQGIQQRSIGIELASLNTPTDLYPAEQLASATLLCRSLVSRFSIPPIMVVRHLDIATPPGRKTDPAGFPWHRFHAGLFPTGYMVRGVPVYQQSDHQGPLWGRLQTGEHVFIDDPVNNHLADGRGFLRDLDGLEPL